MSERVWETKVVATTFCGDAENGDWEIEPFDSEFIFEIVEERLWISGFNGHDDETFCVGIVDLLKALRTLGIHLLDDTIAYLEEDDEERCNAIIHRTPMT